MMTKWMAPALVALLGLAPQSPPASAQVKPAPRRVVSLVPSVTETLFAIGAGDAVVGVSSFDHYPPAVETRVKVGGLVDPDFERILSLRPDLVIVYSGSTLTDRLEQAKISTFIFSHSSLPSVTQLMRELGARLGHADTANARAAEIERRIAEVRAKTSSLRKPRTMMVFEREPGSLRAMFGSGGQGFQHDMLEAAGGVNVFAGVPRESIQITTEQVLAAAPDVILEFRSEPGWTPARALSDRADWKAVGSVPAVRNGRVHILIDPALTIPGPRVANAIETIARILHPEAF